MNFEQNISDLIDNNEEPSYLYDMLESLLFKYRNIIYRQKKIDDSLLNLKKMAEEKINYMRDKLSELDWKSPKIDKELVKSFDNPISHSNSLIEYSEEIDSSNIFYEFETLLLEIGSFIDYYIKILKIFYPNLSTRKSKIIKNIDKKYPNVDILISLKKEIIIWIDQMIKYRDYIVHYATLFSNIKIKVSNSTGSFKISKTSGGVVVSTSHTFPAQEIIYAYLPVNPTYKHKIKEALEDGEINLEDDFYSLDEYLKSLRKNFNRFVEEITPQIENLVKTKSP